MSDSVLELEPPAPDRRLYYGTGPLQFADIRLPAGNKPHPVVLNLHGGFWRARYDLTHTGHLCAALTQAGIATFNVEYRRVGDSGGGWPGTFEDVRRAYLYLQKHARELNFDPERILVMGHSAGGQLALCLGAYESTIRRVVSLAGVLDLQRAYELHLSHDAVVEFLQGSPEQVPKHYREASPMNLRVTARQAIVTGTADDVVPRGFARRYVEAKQNAGEIVELIEIPGAGHMDVIEPFTEAVKTVGQIVQNYLA